MPNHCTQVRDNIFAYESQLFSYQFLTQNFRLSTIVHADKILLISNGEILESGTHKTLLQDGGYYSQLWNEQLKLNIAPDDPDADEHEETKTT